jgi:hypothetical protein
MSAQPARNLLVVGDVFNGDSISDGQWVLWMSRMDRVQGTPKKMPAFARASTGVVTQQTVFQKG